MEHAIVTRVTRNGGLKRRRIEHVAGDHLDTSRPHRGFQKRRLSNGKVIIHRNRPARGQLLHEMTADEAGSPDDE